MSKKPRPEKPSKSLDAHWPPDGVIPLQPDVAPRGTPLGFNQPRIRPAKKDKPPSSTAPGRHASQLGSRSGYRSTRAPRAPAAKPPPACQ